MIKLRHGNDSARYYYTMSQDTIVSIVLAGEFSKLVYFGCLPQILVTSVPYVQVWLDVVVNATAFSVP